MEREGAAAANIKKKLKKREVLMERGDELNRPELRLRLN